MTKPVWENPRKRIYIPGGDRLVEWDIDRNLPVYTEDLLKLAEGWTPDERPCWSLADLISVFANNIDKPENESWSLSSDDVNSGIERKDIEANRVAIHNTWGDRFGKDQKEATDELPSWFHKCPVRGSIVLSGDRVWCGACGQTQTRRAMSAATENKEATDGIAIIEFMQSELPRLVADEHDRRELERSQDAANRAIDRAEKLFEVYNRPVTVKSTPDYGISYVPHERTWRWFGWFRRGD